MIASRRLALLPLLLAGLALCAVLVLVPWVIHAQSQEVTSTPGATGGDPPAPPTNLQTTSKHDEVALTWTASTDQTVTQYAILRRIPDTDALGVFHVIENNAGAETSYTDSSVSASSKYIYRVKAVSPTGVSRWSGFVKVDTPTAPDPTPTPTPMPTPEDLRPTGLTVRLVENKVTLGWTAPKKDAEAVDGYEILRRRPMEGETTLATLVANTESTATTYTDATANEAGVVYVYRVKALRGGVKSRWSNYDRLELSDDYVSPDGELVVPPAQIVLISTPVPASTPEPNDINLDAPVYMESNQNDDIPDFESIFLSITVDQDTGGNGILVPSTWNFVPNGVAEGDKFRLLFVTLNRDGQYVDGDIRAGNNDIIVRQQLESLSHAPIYNGPPIRPYIRHFKALLSTSQLYGADPLNARNVTDTMYSDDDLGVPIYYLSGSKHGRKIADDYKDFYDGTWDTSEARDSNGQRMSGPLKVLTRSDEDGTYKPGTDSGKVWYGDPTSSGKGLVSGEAPASDDYLLYGISPVFRVMEETPDDRSATGLAAALTKTFKMVFVDLTWNAPVSGTPVSYRIERSDGGISKSWRTVLTDTESSATVTPDFSDAENSGIRFGFAPSGYRKYFFPEASIMIDETWCYRVRALYADGSEGPPSEFTCIGGGVPKSPRDPQIRHVDADGGMKEIQMSWTAPSDATADTIYRVVFEGFDNVKGSLAASGEASLTLTSTSNLGTSLHSNIEKLLFGPGEVTTCYPTWHFSNDPNVPGQRSMSSGDVPCEFRIGFRVYAIRGSDGYVSLPVPRKSDIQGENFKVLIIRAPDNARQ